MFIGLIKKFGFVAMLLFMATILISCDKELEILNVDISHKIISSDTNQEIAVGNTIDVGKEYKISFRYLFTDMTEEKKKKSPKVKIKVSLGSLENEENKKYWTETMINSSGKGLKYELQSGYWLYQGKLDEDTLKFNNHEDTYFKITTSTYPPNGVIIDAINVQIEIDGYEVRVNRVNPDFLVSFEVNKGTFVFNETNNLTRIAGSEYHQYELIVPVVATVTIKVYGKDGARYNEYKVSDPVGTNIVELNLFDIVIELGINIDIIKEQEITFKFVADGMNNYLEQSFEIVRTFYEGER